MINAFRLCACVALGAWLSGVTAASATEECPAEEPVTNDVCAGAIPLGNDPQALVLEGNTGLANDDYDVGHDNPCTRSRSQGPDVVFSVQVAPSCILTAQLRLCDNCQWYDQSLYLVADCLDLLGSCQGSDSPCSGDQCPPEEVVWENTTGATQTVFIVVDGKFPSSAGPWTLEVNSDCALPVESSTWGTVKAHYRDGS